MKVRADAGIAVAVAEAECSQQVLVGVLTPGLWDRAGLLCKSVAASSGHD